MAQKVNPISLRLGNTNRNFDSCWFNQSNYVNLLMRDLQIQFYVDSVLKKLDYSSARYFIVNLPTKTKITIFSYDLNKNKYKASRILHINCKKKTKKYKKNLSNISDNRVSLNMNKIFNYLTKNFYTNRALNNLSFHGMLTQLKQNLSFIKVALLQKKLQQFKIKYFVVKYLNGKHTHFQNIFYFNNLIFKLNKNKLLVNLHYYNYRLYVINYLYTHKLSLNKVAKIQEKKFLPNTMVTFQNTDTNLEYYKNIINYNKNLLDKFRILNYLKLHIHTQACFTFSWLQHSESCNLNNSENSRKISRNEILSRNLPSENLIHLAMLHKNNKVYAFNNENKLEHNVSLLQNKSFNISPHLFNLPKSKLKMVYANIRLYLENHKYTSMSIINNLKLKNTNSNKVNFFNYIYKNKLNNETILPFNSETTKSKINAFGDFHNFSYSTLKNPPYKHHLESVIYENFHINVNLLFLKTDNMFMSALFLINEIIYYIEKKVPFLKIKNYILRELTDGITNKKLRIKGLRVICSGRVGGKSKKAQRSKNLNFKYGETSLNIFSGKMDFKSKNAFTSFGTLGLKVWISYY